MVYVQLGLKRLNIFTYTSDNFFHAPEKVASVISKVINNKS